MSDNHYGQKKKDGKSFFTIGCLVMLAAAAVGVYFAYQGAKGYMADKFTDPAPRELPRVQVSDQQAKAVIDRFESFARALQGEGPVESLRLSDRDINTLLQQHPKLTALSDKVFVTIEDNKLKGEIK